MNYFNNLYMFALTTEPDVVEQIPIVEVLGQISLISGHNKNKNDKLFEFNEKHSLQISKVLENILTAQERIVQRGSPVVTRIRYTALMKKRKNK